MPFISNQNWSDLLDLFKQCIDTTKPVDGTFIKEKLDSLPADCANKMYAQMCLCKGIDETNPTNLASCKNEVPHLGLAIQNLANTAFDLLDPIKKKSISSQWYSYLNGESLEGVKIWDAHTIFLINTFITHETHGIPNISKKARPQNDRVLAHIMADEFGQGSELQVAQSQEILKFLCEFLEDRSSASCPYGITPEVLQELKNALIFSFGKLSQFVGSEYIQKAHDVLLPVHQWVKDNKPIYKRNDLVQMAPKFSPLFESSAVNTWEKGALLTPQSPIIGSTGSVQKKGFLLEEMKKMLSLPPAAKEIDTILDNVLSKVTQSWLDAYDYDSHTALNMLLSKIPIT
ncbi:MAG: hypothetical protein JSR46_03610 [Verrucomicrobia bacterium]|nr:hypothetical protein [Verrucomicrobiota bacterium]